MPSSNSAHYRIRATIDGDHPALLDLACSFYREEGFATRPPVLSEHLSILVRSAGARVAVADRAGVLVGFAVTTTKFGLEQGQIAELEDLYVTPAWRSHGIATALIEDSAQWATARGCGELELVIAPTGHDAAGLHDYYTRRGFTDNGRRLISRIL